jgi:hypothetical protein
MKDQMSASSVQALAERKNRQVRKYQTEYKCPLKKHLARSLRLEIADRPWITGWRTRPVHTDGEGADRVGIVEVFCLFSFCYYLLL